MQVRCLLTKIKVLTVTKPGSVICYSTDRLYYLQICITDNRRLQSIPNKMSLVISTPAGGLRLRALARLHPNVCHSKPLRFRESQCAFA